MLEKTTNQHLTYMFECENMTEFQSAQTTYLNALKATSLKLLETIEKSLIRRDIYVKPIRQQAVHRDHTTDKDTRVQMKPKAFFVQTRDLSDQVIRTIRSNIGANTKLSEDERALAFAVLAYACQYADSIMFSLTPRDFLVYLAELQASVDVLVTLAYAFYDMIWTTLSFLRLKTLSIRQVIVPKEKTGTKSKRRLYVTVTNPDVNFQSPVIREVVLQLIEKGVIRCSSIAKCFLVTHDEAKFYKYCLIRGKVCLKAIQDAATIRI